jgi:hypothetical protein
VAPVDTEVTILVALSLVILAGVPLKHRRTSRRFSEMSVRMVRAGSSKSFMGRYL